MGDITNRGLDFIKRKEGYFDKAYLCPAGVWTIGYGTIRWSATRPVKKGDVITRDEAERLLLKEVQRVEDAIDVTITVPLTPGMYDCLCSLFYNIGIGWLTGRGHQQATLVKLLNQGHYDRIPSEILKFKNANGKTIKGLLIRRQEEVRELWLGDYGEVAGDPKHTLSPLNPAVVVETDPVDAPMPQAVEPARPGAIAVVKESPTIWASMVAFVMTIGNGVQQSYEWVFGVAKEAGPEVLALKTTFSPFDALFKLTGPVLLILTATCIAYVISRRISKG